MHSTSFLCSSKLLFRLPYPALCSWNWRVWVLTWSFLSTGSWLFGCQEKLLEEWGQEKVSEEERSKVLLSLASSLQADCISPPEVTFLVKCSLHTVFPPDSCKLLFPSILSGIVCRLLPSFSIFLYPAHIYSNSACFRHSSDYQIWVSSFFCSKSEWYIYTWYLFYLADACHFYGKTNCYI